MGTQVLHASLQSLTSPLGSVPAKVCVLGAGISGLTAAHHLVRLLPASSQITVLEGAERCGGWIKSISQLTPPTHPDVDVVGELIFEAGPRSVTTKGLAGWRALELVKNLDLQDQIETTATNSPAAQNRLIYYPDRIGLLPRSLPSLLLHSRREPGVGVVSALLRESFQPPRSAHAMGDESIDAFFRRRLGPEIADKIISAVIHGIWGGDSRQLSMQAAFPSLVKMERQAGGLLRAQLKSMNPFGKKRNHSSLEERDGAALDGLRPTFDSDFRKVMDKSLSWSLQGGLETLVEALLEDLGKRGVDVQLGTSAQRLTPTPHGVSIETNKGHFEATHAVSTIPSRRLADLLSGASSLPHLRHNPSTSIGVVNVAFLHAANYHFTPMAGAGYLIPRNVAPDYNPYGALGVTFDSDLLPHLDSGYSLAPAMATYRAPLPTVYTKLSVLLGGPHWADKPPHALPSGDLLVQQAIRTLQGHFDWPTTMLPSFAHAHLQRECIPQYLVGHPARMRELAQALKDGPWQGRLSVAGASYNGVSVRDCILSGYEVARRLSTGLPAHGLERIEDGAMGDCVESAMAVDGKDGLAGDVST